MTAIEHSHPDTVIETGRIGGRGDGTDLYTVGPNRPRFDARRQGLTTESNAANETPGWRGRPPCSITRGKDHPSSHNTKGRGYYYSSTGRPSVDSELMIRMLIVGDCFGIRSERRLCEEVHLNLGYRWFCRLGLEGAVPDHFTLSKNRHGRFRDSDHLREVFDKSCRKDGAFSRSGFSFDIEAPTSVRAARHSNDIVACSRSLGPASIRTATCAIAPAVMTAEPAYSSRNAARKSQPAKSCAQSTRGPAIWHATSLKPMPGSPPGASERRWRCCSAHLKRILKLDRLRLRGPQGARDAFLLAATAQNLRKLAKLIPMPAPVTAG